MIVTTIKAGSHPKMSLSRIKGILVATVTYPPQKKPRATQCKLKPKVDTISKTRYFCAPYVWSI